jgi:alginate O-acetyltransferase complex protein AlgJ
VRPAALIAALALGVALVFVLPVLTHAATSDEIRAALAKRCGADAPSAIKGMDGWLFLTAELRSYSRGRFWGADAAAINPTGKDQDPLAAIVAFDAMLKKAGITLILAPVPGKVTVYADQLDPALATPGRWDDLHQAFFADLTKAGVQVVDLVPDFMALRKQGENAYCKQDSHWSPAAMRLTAQRLAALIKPQPWYAAVPKKTPTLKPVSIEVAGDLSDLVVPKNEAKETLAIEQVEFDGAPVESDDKSPVVLMGDSHTLVFNNGQLLADRAGLPDHLGAELGFAVDSVGVMGSGANGSRMTLARRKDNLAGKKCVVWVFTAREFTESLQGWKQIPVIR